MNNFSQILQTSGRIESCSVSGWKSFKRSAFKAAFMMIAMLCSTLISAQDVYRIGLMVEKDLPETERLFVQLKEEVQAVVGVDALVEFPEEYVLTDEFLLDRAQRNYQQLLDSDVDLILAFGPLSSWVVSQQTQFPKPTVLFGAMDQEFTQTDLQEGASGVPNLARMVSSRSFTKDLTDLRELSGFEKVGIAIEDHYRQISDLESTFDQVLQEVGGTYSLITFTTVEDIIADCDDVDAIYLAGGFFLNKEQISRLAAELIDRGIPSFTSTGVDDVRMGLMATNRVDENIDRIMRRIALTIEAHVNGTPLQEVPVYLDERDELTLNYNTAVAVGVPLKFSRIANTHFVGDPDDRPGVEHFDLLQVIAQTLDSNLYLQARQKDIAVQDKQVDLSQSNYLPDVAAKGSYTHIQEEATIAGFSPEHTANTDVTLQQVLFSPSASANIAIQRALLEAEKENYRADALDLIHSASQAYFGTLRARMNLRITVQNLELTKRNLLMAEENFDAGRSGKADVLRFRSELARNTQSMVEAINGVGATEIGLNQLMNRPLEREIQVEHAVMGEGVFQQYDYTTLIKFLDDRRTSDPFIEFLTKKAMENAPELRSIAHNQEVLQRGYDLYSKGRFLPTVGGQAQYRYNIDQWGAGAIELDPPGSYNLGVNLSLPIFAQDQNRINRKLTAIQLDQLQLNQDNLELSIAAQVSQQVLDLTNRIANVRLSGVFETTAEESLELSQTAYSSGSINVVQLLDAQNNLLQARLASANATYDYLESALALERAIGYFFLLGSQQENDAFRAEFNAFMLNRRP